MDKNFEVLTISNLEKIMPDKRPELVETENSCFKNEVFSFQVAYYSHSHIMLQVCTWEICGDIAEFVSVRPVKPVPCTTPCYNDADEYYLTKTPALIPDLLSDENGFTLGCKMWKSLFVTVKGNLPAGKHDICLLLKDGVGNLLGSCKYTLDVLDFNLPRTDLIFAHWFHYDSIAAYYGVEVFSERYTEIMSEYIKNAVAHGVNMLYVPLFTSPTNTKIGGERLTVQLVDVFYADGKYTFDFSRLKNFMSLLVRLNVKYFEMSHLYTQWGAKYAPKIVVYENGNKVKKFGWNDDALGEEYKKFMSAFLPQLISFLKENGYGEETVYFHISDEPNEKSLEHYLQIKNFIKPMLGDYKIMDALSNYDFFKFSAVDIPIVTTDAIQPFVEAGVKDLWVYYCCGQGYGGLSNRFISMPLYRTRVLGVQLYVVNCNGLLHWGYNYYNTALSEDYIDPYFVTDAGGSFQSGDSFVVYPSKCGTPLDSMRHEVLADALQDFAALKLLESQIGREKTLEFIFGFGVKPNFSDYPKNAEWIIDFRKKLNEKIR